MKIFEKAKLEPVREEYISYVTKSGRCMEKELTEMKEYIMGDDCVRDLERLKSGDYFLDYPRYRLVPKNFQNKKRAVYSFTGTEGYLMKLVVYAMRGMEDIYSDRLFSFRHDKTGTDLLSEVSRDGNIWNKYVFKADISNYVGSIVPKLIIPMLQEVFLPDDPDFFSFLKWLLTRNKVVDKDGNILDHCPGGMGGVPVGNFFMNLYLHEMDDYFAPRAAFYSRYSDDILICADTYEEIKEFEKHFYEILDRLRLVTNKEKTVILMPGEPFDLMGMELSGGCIRISAHAMNKIKRRIRKYADRALINRNKGRMSPDEAAHDLIMRFNRYFFGGVRGGVHGGESLTWAKWVFPIITDTECLKEIDNYIQESIRYVLYGSMKKRKYSIPYEKLTELGYRTIVYYYHHQDMIQEII